MTDKQRGAKYYAGSRCDIYKVVLLNTLVKNRNSVFGSGEACAKPLVKTLF